MLQKGAKAARRWSDGRHAAQLAKSFGASAKRSGKGEAYVGLSPYSLAFASVPLVSNARTHLNLVVPELSVNGVFAGLRTALDVAFGLGDRMGVPVRVVVLKHVSSARSRLAVKAYLSSEFARSQDSFDVIPIEAIEQTGFSIYDYWIATHWTTAHPLDVASRLGVIDARNVMYLVQDYEPGFYPWSTEYALAESTYDAGFRFIVNSRPVADYLESTVSVRVPDAAVFHPKLDLPRLEEAAAARVASDVVRLLFYSRPSKPRNLFAVGRSALKIVRAMAKDEGIELEISSAGESHSPIKSVRSLGKLPWSAYFDQLSRTDVVFSLQLSPHPSHPPLDGVVSGCVAVVNDVGRSRDSWDPNLIVSPSSPDLLASALIQGALKSKRIQSSFRPELLSTLGRPLHDVLDGVISDLDG